MTKISTILHLAADDFLLDGVVGFGDLDKGYSEVRAVTLMLKAHNLDWRLINDIRQLWRDMGQPIGDAPYVERWPAETVPEGQRARYAWLKFSALVAEEEGR